MNLLDLPRDIILGVWSYLVHNEDIFSFSFTCKMLQLMAFIPERHLKFTEKTPEDIRDYLLSQDLSHLQTFWCTDIIARKTPANQFMLARLTIFSTLNNLTHVEFDSEFVEQQNPVADVVSKMTWLEKLRFWPPVPRQDIGDFLANHSRLTMLGYSFADEEDPALGLDKLTQIKHLEIQNLFEEQTLFQLLQLTNLTCLNIIWSRLVSDQTKNITRLTKLEDLNISGVATASDWTAIATLPNLRNFSAEISELTQEYVEALQQFTQLTGLDLAVESLPRSPDIFYRLTNLRQLSYYLVGPVPNSADYSPLIHLTKLVCTVSNDLDPIALPPLTKKLSIYHIPRAWMSDGRFFDGICNATKLQKLELFSESLDFDNLSGLQDAITRLVNLRSLVINFRPTRDLCHSLKHLPSLRKLNIKGKFYLVEDYAMDALKELEQLVELWITSTRPILLELRQNLPFAVYLNELF